MSFPTITSPPQSLAEVIVNQALQTLEALAVYGQRQAAHSGLTWGYYGGRWGGNSIADGTLTLTDNATNYVVVDQSTGAITVSSSNTNWNNTAAYARVYLITTVSGVVTAIQDHRAGPNGVLGAVGAGGGGGDSQCIPIACSDETTALTTGTAKVTFRMPYAFTLTEVRASLTTAPTGAALVVDINEGGSSIMGTDKLSIDATETTSTTAATPADLTDTALADNAVITIDVDQVGSTVAGAGLKVYLIGTPT